MTDKDNIIMDEENSCEWTRRMNDLSQKELAEMLGISRRTYATRIGSDDPMWQLDELVILAEMNSKRKVVAKSKGKCYEITIKGLH